MTMFDSMFMTATMLPFIFVGYSFAKVVQVQAGQKGGNGKIVPFIFAMIGITCLNQIAIALVWFYLAYKLHVTYINAKKQPSNSTGRQSTQTTGRQSTQTNNRQATQTNDRHATKPNGERYKSQFGETTSNFSHGVETSAEYKNFSQGYRHRRNPVKNNGIETADTASREPTVYK